jgi:hypothetical protein
MKKYVVVKTQFMATHQWSTCEHIEVIFLRHPHRHIFYVTVWFEVQGSDRELEFFMTKKDIDLAVNVWNDRFIGNMSCEMLAEEIVGRLHTIGYNTVHRVDVFEDNENGAVIYV